MTTTIALATLERLETLAGHLAQLRRDGEDPGRSPAELQRRERQVRANLASLVSRAGIDGAALSATLARFGIDKVLAG
jgi:uncharacterized membrane protein